MEESAEVRLSFCHMRDVIGMRATITREQAIEEGWYRPNERDGKCYCTCGATTDLARQSSRRNRTVRGEPNLWLTGHSAVGANNARYGKVGTQAGRYGANSANWQGGTRNLRGYVQMWIPKGHQMASMRSKAGYVPQHRLFMAEHLGRSLVRGEVVHHKNNIRHDNRLENLELTNERLHGQIHKERAALAERILKVIEMEGSPEEWLAHRICGA